MKIRNGFVSNSSSSSFIMLGIEVPKDILSKEEPKAPKISVTTPLEEISKIRKNYEANLAEYKKYSERLEQLYEDFDVDEDTSNDTILIGDSVDSFDDCEGFGCCDFKNLVDSQQELIERLEKAGFKNFKLQLLYGVQYG